MVQAVIFDVGGVLMHSDRADYDEIGAGVGLPRGALWSAIHDIPEYHPSRTGEITNAEFRVAVVTRLADEIGATAAEATIRRVEALYQQVDAVRPVMCDLLLTLRRKGTRLGLLSNAPKGSTAKAKASGLSSLFDAAVFTGDVGIAKPDPAVFQLVARKLHALPARCLFVDDVPEYVDAATALGMRGHVYHWTRHHELEATLRERGLVD